MPRMLAELGRLICVKNFPITVKSASTSLIPESHLACNSKSFLFFLQHFLFLWSREYSLSSQEFYLSGSNQH